VPPAADLARGAELKVVGYRTVAVIPHFEAALLKTSKKQHVRFTTDRGDRLTLHYVGMRVDPTTFLCQVVATRGTGRFTGATVDATLWIQDYSPNRPFDCTFDGTIEYP
jgi:hypothetical protein